MVDNLYIENEKPAQVIEWAFSLSTCRDDMDSSSRLRAVLQT